MGNGIGSNLQVNFTEDANMKGNIYTQFALNGPGTTTVTFSGSNNTFIGRIGNFDGLGTSNVTFNNLATIQAGTDGYIMYAKVTNGGTITNNLTLKAGGSITGNTISGGSEGTLTNLLTLTTTGTTTLSGDFTANYNGTNTIDVQNGTTLNLTGNLSTTQGKNIVKFSGTGTGSIQGNITTDKATTYIINTGSGAVAVGNNNTITMQNTSGAGGYGYATYITDYDSQTSGFKQEGNSTSTANLTLNLNKISFRNGSGSYQNQQGQKFFIDYKTGNATIDSGNNNGQSLDWNNRYGNTIVMRFRDSNDTGVSSITIGSAGNNNGNLSANGVYGQALFQAKTINAYGNISSNYGSKTIVWGNQIDLHGGSITSSSDGQSQKSKSIIVADGTNAVIKADSLSVDSTGEIYVLLNGASSSATIEKTNGGNGKPTFSLSGAGGIGNAKIFITDYNSTNLGANDRDTNKTDGFSEDLTSLTPTNSTFTLDIAQIAFANNDGNKIGQTFVLDTYDGTATINSGESTQSPIKSVLMIVKMLENNEKKRKEMR